MGGLFVLMGGMAQTGGVARAQQETPGSGAIPGVARPIEAPGDSAVPDDPMRAEMKEERTRMINDERHKRLEDDVAKLQALTKELKTDVDKANQDELSPEVVRKTGEIEKLAHDVQSRMKD